MLWKDYMWIRVSINIQNQLKRTMKLGNQVVGCANLIQVRKTGNFFFLLWFDWSYRQVLPQTKSSSGK